MKKTTRRRPRADKDTIPNQQTMDGNFRINPSAYLVQTFSLNSLSRQVARKGLNRQPNPRFSRANSPHTQTLSQIESGRKCSDVDLDLLSRCFQNYAEAVNLALSRVYSSVTTIHELGRKLSERKGRGYTVLREEASLDWKRDNEFGHLVFERMYRNVLETTARIVLSDFTRRQLINTLLELLDSDHNLLTQLVSLRRIPSHIVRTLRNKTNDGSIPRYYCALYACRQVRRALNDKLKAIPCPTPSGSVATDQVNGSKIRVRGMLRTNGPTNTDAHRILFALVSEWRTNGFPFAIPEFRRHTMDFAASTENGTGQGYWFTLDPTKKDEIILYIKTPPGVLAHDRDLSSPYRSQTIRFRFVNWLPTKSARARQKAENARDSGDVERAVVLEYRAAILEDMSQQLLSTIALHHATRSAPTAKPKQRAKHPTTELENLRKARRCAPPILRAQGKRVALLIPFLPPSRELLEKAIPMTPRVARAGVDRGLRYPVVISVQNGNGLYQEKQISHKELLFKRERLRQRTRTLMSQIDRRRNNWEKKRPGLYPPAQILKKERELEAVWLKVRRLDREISHQVASETVWFCEHNAVKTVCFEDLKSFQPKSGMHAFSWRLSTNLWGQIIEGVRYRRIALGHRFGGVWIVNPAWTSQTCSVCGERGLRTNYLSSSEEAKGGEYFYCPTCQTRLHADINAARNISMISTQPSAVPGRTNTLCPSLSNLQ